MAVSDQYSRGVPMPRAVLLGGLGTFLPARGCRFSCELFDQSFAQILAAVLPTFLPNFLHVSVGQQDLHAASAHEGVGFARKSL